MWKACRGLWSRFLTAVKLVARVWIFVDSVLNTEKAVRSMQRFGECVLAATKLVGGL